MLGHLKEATKLFRELTPENQANLLKYARVARTAENAAKKSVTLASRGEDENKHE